MPSNKEGFETKTITYSFGKWSQNEFLRISINYRQGGIKLSSEYIMFDHGLDGWVDEYTNKEMLPPNCKVNTTKH